MIHNWLAVLFLLAIFGGLLLFLLKIEHKPYFNYYKIGLFLLSLIFIKTIIPLFSVGFLEFFSQKTSIAYLITSILGNVVDISIILTIVYISTIIVKKVFNKNEK